MYNLSGDTVSYDFTPGWFDDIEVKKIENSQFIGFPSILYIYYTIE